MGRLEFPTLKSPRIVAIPIAFNEELKIAGVLDRFAEVNELTLRSFEDRSTDRTPQVIVEKGATIIQHGVQSGGGSDTHGPPVGCARL